ncbi:hypothetical protein SAMN05421512_103245 [Stappia indica]|uniref:Uncharacterized protein n=1 Tax=Stappia indica TaxID=538381 RepID=A0A285S084_9HYPH|nr:hypothetical protein SAMN05421512_103245 [Stappia indica]
MPKPCALFNAPFTATKAANGVACAGTTTTTTTRKTTA